MHSRVLKHALELALFFVFSAWADVCPGQCVPTDDVQLRSSICAEQFMNSEANVCIISDDLQEKAVLKTIDETMNSGQWSKKCRKKFEDFICRMTYSPCDDSGEILRPTLNECLKMVKSCIGRSEQALCFGLHD
ncbi:MAG: hypothetical protein EZS28_011054 [Streblomastix strix]|uniref:FZ domain-containing protein n=1 Tax=Streblomastix strix TaxID=222440 RepID=A0A5J4WEN5_9EUKA|nr:MAG: hypothetical protein EZS28_011054 [Streblomastix strix]